MNRILRKASVRSRGHILLTCRVLLTCEPSSDHRDWDKDSSRAVSSSPGHSLFPVLANSTGTGTRDDRRLLGPFSGLRRSSTWASETALGS